MPKRSAPDGCAASTHGRPIALPPVDAAALERAANIFRALGEVPRLRLVALLGQGSACVTELARAEGEDVSTISQRLRVLRSEKLVTRRRNGKHINYSLSDQHIVDLIFNALAHASEEPAHAPPAAAAARSKGTGL